MYARYTPGFFKDASTSHPLYKGAAKSGGDLFSGRNVSLKPCVCSLLKTTWIQMAVNGRAFPCSLTGPKYEGLPTKTHLYPRAYSRSYKTIFLRGGYFDPPQKKGQTTNIAMNLSQHLAQPENNIFDSSHLVTFCGMLSQQILAAGLDQHGFNRLSHELVHFGTNGDFSRQLFN